MKKSGSRMISWLLTLAVVVCVCQAPAAARDAMSAGDAKLVLNSIELHPQPTGYTEMDHLLETMLQPYAGEDNYTKLKAMYDWIVENVDYSWEGYSKKTAPAYDKFTLTYDLTYESDAPKAFPDEIINRSYHTLTAKKGVCYDYAALYAVMARYIGAESYVHTGILQKGSWRGHHGYTIIRANGVDFIFDPQQDYREWQAKRDWHAHFGIDRASSGRYEPESEVNAERDKGFLPLPLESTPAPVPEPAAQPTQEVVQETSPEPSIADEEWYQEVLQAAQSFGLLTREEAETYPGDSPSTRAQAVVLLARLDNADLTQYPDSDYTDVLPGSPTAAAIQWASRHGVVTGGDDSRFYPDGEVTREQFLTILMRYLTTVRGMELPSADLFYTDTGEISDYAWDSVSQAEAMGLVTGTGGGAFQPQRGVAQAETLTFLVRLAVRLDAPAAAQ